MIGEILRREKLVEIDEAKKKVSIKPEGLKKIEEITKKEKIFSFKNKRKLF